MKMFKILTVCTGNICRSPLAEALLRSELKDEVFKVESSGIRATPGATVPDRQQNVGRELGLEGLERHRGQLTHPQQLAEAGLILSMSRGHRKRVLRLSPSIARRSFTLREFARLAAAVTPNDVEEQLATHGAPLEAAVSAVAGLRGMLPPPRSKQDDDVIDPYRKSARVYRRSRDELVPAAHTTAMFLNSIVELFGAHSRAVTVDPLPTQVTIPDIHFVSASSRLRTPDSDEQTTPDSFRKVS